MALINVRQLSINRSGVNIPTGSQARFFSDNFTRANAASLGSQWGFFYSGNTASGSLTYTTGINANKCRFVSNASVGTASVAVYPLLLAWMTQTIQNQFVEVVVAANTNGFQFLAGVAMQPNVCNSGFGFYGLQMTASGAALGLNRANWSAGNLNVSPTFTALSALGGTTAVFGDVLRLEARNVAGTWNLICFKNGTNIGSASDATLGAGVPCMFNSQSAASSSLDITSFNSGIL